MSKIVNKKEIKAITVIVMHLRQIAERSKHKGLQLCGAGGKHIEKKKDAFTCEECRLRERAAHHTGPA